MAKPSASSKKVANAQGPYANVQPNVMTMIIPKASLMFLIIIPITKPMMQNNMK